MSIMIEIITKEKIFSFLLISYIIESDDEQNSITDDSDKSNLSNDESDTITSSYIDSQSTDCKTSLPENYFSYDENDKEIVSTVITNNLDHGKIEEKQDKVQNNSKNEMTKNPRNENQLSAYKGKSIHANKEYVKLFCLIFCE